MQKPSIPKGTRDFSPEEMAERNYIFNTIQRKYIICTDFSRSKRRLWKTCLR